MGISEEFYAFGLADLERRTEWPGEEAGYALPCGSLAFLEGCVRRLEIHRVFEFGSGASTRLFLRLGCRLTCLEDGRQWLDQTLASVTGPERRHVREICEPLRGVWCGAIPCQGWRLSPAMIDDLREAQLVLVDSPAYPPFREAALVQALTLAPGALVVLDDLRIPTLRRFSDRIAAQSPGLLYRVIERDHHLGIFCRPATARLRNRHGLMEWAKGVRRFVQAERISG